MASRKTKKATKSKPAKRAVRTIVVNAPARKAGGKKKNTGGGESAYGKLLYNPCTAMLTPAAYDASGSGLQMRLRGSTVLGNGVGSTSGVLHWTPGFGAIGKFEVTTGTTGGTLTGTSDTFVGGGFIGTQTSSFRCIAACIRITALCANQVMVGTIGLGNTTYNSLANGGSYTPEQVLSMLPNCMRISDATKEIVWLPNAVDEEFWNTGASLSTASGNKSALTFAFSGCPAATGFRVDFFEVVEYYPLSSLGIYANISPPPASDLKGILRQFWAKHGSTVKDLGTGMLKMGMAAMF